MRGRRVRPCIAERPESGLLAATATKPRKRTLSRAKRTTAKLKKSGKSTDSLYPSWCYNSPMKHTRGI